MQFEIDIVALQQVHAMHDDDDSETAVRAILDAFAAQLRPYVPGAREDEGLLTLLGSLVAAPVERDKIWADVGEWLPDPGSICDALQNELDNGNRYNAAVDAFELAASHLAPRLTALQARVRELEAELASYRDAQVDLCGLRGPLADLPCTLSRGHAGQHSDDEGGRWP